MKRKDFDLNLADSKNCGSGSGGSSPIVIEEIAYNAVAVTWNRSESSSVKVGLQ